MGTPALFASSSSSAEHAKALSSGAAGLVRAGVQAVVNNPKARETAISTTRNVGNQPGQDPETTGCAAGTRCEDVTAGGNVHVFNASINLKF